MNHDRRISALERLFAEGAAQEDADSQGRRELVACLDECSGMRALMSEKSYRGSPRGLVKIETCDVAREHYAGDYTHQEFLELAVLRALRGLGYSPEEIDERAGDLLETFAGLMGSEDR